jgi:hypothetical protein
MPSLGGMLGTIGQDVSTGLGAAKPFLTGFGIVDQILQARQQQDLLNRAMSYQKDPKKLAQLVQQYTQPLNQGLVAGVGNAVQGQMAERGLAQSPAIWSEVAAQSLAPYQQQNQQRALEMALQVMGIPLSALPYLNRGGTGGLAQLIASLPGGGGQPSGTAAGVPVSGGGTISGITMQEPDWTGAGGAPQIPGVNA